MQKAKKQEDLAKLIEEKKKIFKSVKPQKRKEKISYFVRLEKN